MCVYIPMTNLKPYFYLVHAYHNFNNYHTVFTMLPNKITLDFAILQRFISFYLYGNRKYNFIICESKNYGLIKK